MGRIIFDPESLADELSETVGYKAGLALSVEQICDLLSGTHYPDVILQSETHMVTLHSEEFEKVFYKLLHKIGHTEEETHGLLDFVTIFHRYKETPQFDVFMGVSSLFGEMQMQLIDEAIRSDKKMIDPSPFLKVCSERYGKTGLDIAIELIQVLDRGIKLNPYSAVRPTEWKNVEHLDLLFSGSNHQPEQGEYIDQRFIDYLRANPDSVRKMHWRKFEELTAEYFHRGGYEVELGTGRNDDGVDVRVWKPGSAEQLPPHYIIQCKRQQKKIEKVVIKGLYADVLDANADNGLIVTSSELSPGARKTIIARGYPIEEINNEGVAKWLATLRTPGTGIVRIK